MADGKKILENVWQLPKFGDEATEWSKLLTPIIRGIMVSYECPEVPAARDFWLKACYATGRNGSGDTIETLSGWLSAFCFCDKEGRRICGHTEDELNEREGNVIDRRPLELEDQTYPIIGTREIPPVIMYVPAKIQDLVAGEEHPTVIIAGSMAMALTKDGTTVQPRSGWFLLQQSVKPLP